MMDDYFNRFYLKQAKRKALLSANNYEKAKEISEWKEKMAAGWSSIEVVSIDIPENLIKFPQVGEDYKINITVDVKQEDLKGIGIELVAIRTDQNNNSELSDVQELTLVKTEGTKMFFSINYELDNAGAYKYGFRMYPKHELLPHRQDFCYVRWL